jgi:hypothetical protein
MKTETALAEKKTDVFTKAKRSEMLSRIRSRGNKDTEVVLARLSQTRNTAQGQRRILAQKNLRQQIPRPACDTNIASDWLARPPHLGTHLAAGHQASSHQAAGHHEVQRRESGVAVTAHPAEAETKPKTKMTAVPWDHQHSATDLMEML